MTDTTAAFCDVTPFNGARASLGDLRRMARAIGGSLAVGLGAVAAVGLVVIGVMLASAWILRGALAPHLQASAPARLKTIALADDYPSFAGTSRFSGVSVVLVTPADTPPSIPATQLARATAAPAEAPAVPERVAEAMPSLRPVPMPRARPASAPQAQVKQEPIRVPEPVQVAVLAPPAPPAAPAAAPAATPPLPLMVAPDTVSDVPLPQPRPLSGKQQPAKPETAGPVGEGAPQVAAVTPASPPPAPAPAPVEKRPAPPQQQAHNKAFSLPGADSRTAVYDISARTVYLPSGEKLEAHSGLYDKMDDPRYVNVKMRGPTPPNVYDLTLREQLFHGVRAIRLNPVDESKMFGRDGMLAHTYMLGPNGQSNGCVSFRDYDKFLNAFLKGEVDRLVVVSHLGDTPVPVATRTRRKHGNRYAAYDAPAAVISPTW